MPKHAFICLECNHPWDELLLKTYHDQRPLDQQEEELCCPECGSNNKDRRAGGGCNVAVKFGNPVGTDKWNSHDYRYYYNHDRKGGVRDQREAAEKASHMGSDPYSPIDDITSGEYEGPVE